MMGWPREPERRGSSRREGGEDRGLVVTARVSLRSVRARNQCVFGLLRCCGLVLVVARSANRTTGPLRATRTVDRLVDASKSAAILGSTFQGGEHAAHVDKATTRRVVAGRP